MALRAESRRRAGIDARLVLEREHVELQGEVEEQLYHIAHEALNNALRHANASTVVVRIYTVEDTLVLSVEDDGTGFDPTSPSAGLGLVSIQERADAIGAHVTITSSARQGTTVKISAPFTGV